MPGRSSNKDRIARMAAEKAAERREKAQKTKKKKKAPRKSTSRSTKSSAAATGRIQVVWVVCDHAGQPVKSYPYSQQREAEKEAKKLSDDKGKPHFVKKDKVPMES